MLIAYPYRHYLNTFSHDKDEDRSGSVVQCKKKSTDQESIQSSTTPDPGYQWESDNFTFSHHKREPRGQPFPSRWPQGIWDRRVLNIGHCCFLEQDTLSNVVSIFNLSRQKNVPTWLKMLTGTLSINTNKAGKWKILPAIDVKVLDT